MLTSFRALIARSFIKDLEVNNVSFKELYEKLYFHEIESREHLNGRLQTPLAIIMSIIAILAFMLQNLNKDIWSLGSLIFYVFFFGSVLSIGISIYFFVRSWYGNTYSFLPSAAETESYRKELINTYQSYPSGKSLAESYFDEYVLNCYISCSSINTACNDERSISLHKTNTFIIITGVTAFLAFLLFYSFGLDKANIEKVLSVKVVNEVKTNTFDIEKIKPVVNISIQVPNKYEISHANGEINEQSKTTAANSTATAINSTATATKPSDSKAD